MKTRIHTLFTILFLLVTSCFAEQQGPSLTVYSSADPANFDPQKFISLQQNGFDVNSIWQVPGFGVVKDTRQVSLVKGLNEIQFTDVARFIDPTTVSIGETGNGTGLQVLEQNFKFDLVNPSRLLEKYIDQDLELIEFHGEKSELIRGTLLSAHLGKLVLQTNDGIRILNQSGNIKLGKLPGGLRTKPALIWKLHSDKQGASKLRTTYQTNGITWRSDYNLVLNETEEAADLTAWVTLMNLTGTSFKNAKLKLVAGDVQRIQAMQSPISYKVTERAMQSLGDNSAFQEKSFFEYHLYTLPRRIDVDTNATQQITLFPAAKDIGTEKIMVYAGQSQAEYWAYGVAPHANRSLGTPSNTKLDVYMRFKNSKDNNLGLPLPAGKIRVYKEDKQDNTLEFIGEDLVDHTPKDEKVLIKLGQAFDVVGEHKQTDFESERGNKRIRESFEIRLKNHKDKAQKVIVKETLYRWLNWKIVKKSDAFTKQDARTIHFETEVPANGEKVITYTVQYDWE